MISNWRDYLFCLLLELFCLSLAIFLVVNLTPLYWIDIHLMNLERSTGIKANFIMGDYLRIINYIQNPFYQHLKFHHFASTANGIKHFSDVKHLIIFNNLFMVVSGLFTLRGIIKLSLLKQRWRMMVPIKVLMITLLALVTVVLVNFDKWFILFHKLVFRNQDWIFNPDYDPIINALPIGFFVQSFLLLIIFIAVLNCLLYYLGKRDLK